MSRTDVNVQVTSPHYWKQVTTRASSTGVPGATDTLDGFSAWDTTREYRAGTTTTDYRARVRLGLPLPPRAFSYIKEVRRRPIQNGTLTYFYPPSGFNHTWYSNTPQNLSTEIPAIDYISGPSIAQIDQRAILNLLSRAKNSSVNVGIVVGERRQTISLLVNTASRLATAIKAVKRGDLRSAAGALGVHVSKRKHVRHRRQLASSASRQSQLDSISRGWLELQYGWKPLLTDVYGSVEAVAKANLDPQYSVVRGSARRNSRISFGRVLSDPGVFPNTTGYAQGSFSWEVHYVCNFTESAGPIRTMKELGLTNPLSVAWELVPFSFVVDWFLPIGNYLGSLDAVCNMTFRSGCKTTVLRFEGERGQYSAARTSVRAYDLSVRETGKGIKVTRELISAFPSLRPPQFKNPLSVGHVANAMALLKLNFRK